MTSIIKLTRRAALVIAVAGIVLLGVVSALLGSQAGTRFLTAEAAKTMGDTMRWRSIEGSLIGPITLHGLQVSSPGVDLSVERVDLDWHLPALFAGELRITKIHSTTATIELKDGETETEPQPVSADAFDPDSLHLPLGIRIDSLALRDLTLISASGPPQRVNSIDARARWIGGALVLETLEVRTPEGGGRVRLETDLKHLDRPLPIAVDATWDWNLRDTDGEPRATPQPLGAPLSGDLHLEGSIDLAKSRVEAALTYTATTKGLEALDPDLPTSLPLYGNLILSAADDSMELEEITVHIDERDARIRLQGDVSALSADVPDADITLDWEALQWPLDATAPLAASSAGNLWVSGTPDDYALELSAALRGVDIPPGAWQLSATGNRESLDLNTLSARVLDGTLSSNGTVGWTPAPTWRLRLEGDGLNPEALEPAAAGQLAFTVTTEGVWDSTTGPDLKLVLEDLSGVIAGRPLAMQAEARVADDAMALAALNLQSQGNTLTAAGSASETALDLKWNLDIANPSALMPDMTGRVSAIGSVMGSVAAPELSADIEGRSVGFEDLHLQRLDGKVHIGMGADSPLSLVLEAQELVSGEETVIEAAELVASGTLAAHTLSLDGNTPRESIALELTGSADIAEESWDGDLSALALATEAYGNWRIEAPAALNYSGDRVALGNTCLRQDGAAGTLCASVDQAAEGSVSASLRIDALPTEAFVPDITGDLAGSGNVYFAPSGTLRADLNLGLGAGDVLVPMDGDTQRLAHEGGAFVLFIDETGLTSRLDFAAPEEGRINADISLPGLNRLPLNDDQVLGGRVTMTLPRLDLISAWVPDVSDIGGYLDGDIRLGGTLTTPLLEGGIALREGKASVPIAGLQLHAIGLELASIPEVPGRLGITGSLSSGEGTAALKGNLDLRSTEFDLSLAGERLVVYDTPDARVFLSPDIAIAWADSTLKLRGSLLIPEASITPQLQLRSAATSDETVDIDTPGEVLAPSPDILIINADPSIPVGSELEASAPFSIDSEVRFVLGDAVEIRALGFASRIDGAVTFTNSLGRSDLIPIADGSLSLRDGTFRAFNQDLNIETGQLLFDRVLATEPELNVRAVRYIENDPQVSAAGVLLTGPATEPVLEMFSRPQLDIGDIQSYLLTGSSSAERSNALAIGTNLTPRLYVKYGYSVLESTSEFSSLFTITPRYGISANAGEADSNVNLTVIYER